MRGLLFLGLLLPSLVWAQLPSQQVEPELRITSDGSFVRIQNAYPDYIPVPPFALPDSGFVVGVSLFTAITPEGDTVGIGVVYSWAGVTGSLVHARTATGEAALGCPDSTTGRSDIANDLTGHIALVQRGACFFIDKTVAARDAGATAIVIHNAPDLVPDRAVNMSSPATSPVVPVGIPAVFLPWSIARPLVEASQRGTPMCGRMMAYPYTLGANDSLSAACTFVATGTGPDLSAFSLELASPNPVHGVARLALAVADPQAVRVEAFNALGQRVGVLHDGAAVGALALTLDTSALAPGVYLVRAVAGGMSRTVRLTVVR